MRFNVGELAQFGPFFSVETHSSAALPNDGWRVMSELTEQPAALSERIERVQAALAAAAGRPIGEVEVRVAASVTQLGLVARLVSPALALAVLNGSGLELDLTRLRWKPELGGAFPLSVPADSAPSATLLLSGAVTTLSNAVEVGYAVSEHVLWGNVASAINGAANMICRQRPDLAVRAGSVARTVLSEPPLDVNQGIGSTFRRNSCCLIYRIGKGDRGGRADRGAVCGDCILS